MTWNGTCNFDGVPSKTTKLPSVDLFSFTVVEQPSVIICHEMYNFSQWEIGARKYILQLWAEAMTSEKCEVNAKCILIFSIDWRWTHRKSFATVSMHLLSSSTYYFKEKVPSLCTSVLLPWFSYAEMCPDFISFYKAFHFAIHLTLPS